MSNANWKKYFDEKATKHGSSVKSSDYYDDKSFFMQRDNTLGWLGKLEGKEILDGGCGVGAFSEPLVKDNTVYGIDFSAKSIAFAKKRGLNARVGDLTALKFAEGKFDVVMCIGVIQLIDNYMAILKELARVTKPGGTMLIQTLHKGSLQRKALRLFEKEKKFDRMYNFTELKDAFLDLGFSNIEFQKMYHPFSCVSASDSTSPMDMFCTSFAIKGVKNE